MRRSNIGIGFVGLLLAAAGFAFAVVALRPASAAGSAQARSPTSVTVTATEFKFKLSRKTVPVGTVVFHVSNKGRLSHDFKIAGKKTPMIHPGKSASLRVVFKKKGRLQYLCTVPGHAAGGMKGTLRVT